MKDYTKISSMDELIEHEYGSSGSDSRIEFEKQSKIFIEKVLLKKLGWMQILKTSKLQIKHWNLQECHLRLKASVGSQSPSLIMIIKRPMLNICSKSINDISSSGLTHSLLHINKMISIQFILS